MKIHPGDRYALSVPPSCMISLRGLQLMVEDYTKAYDGRPVGIILTELQFNRLCHEARRAGRTLADEDAGELPTFEGIPIDLLDGGREWEAEILGVAE